MERIHTKPSEKSKNVKTIDHFYGQKSLGETVARLAIDGIPFRTIAESENLREAV